MTEREPVTIQDEAIAWHVRLKEGGPEDWDAFMAWLEADPARSEAYDRVKIADAAITPEMIPAAAAPVAANDSAERAEQPGYGKWRWASALAGLAAILLVGLIAFPWFMQGPDRFEIATRPGEQRRIAIGEGDTAVLNGGTRLILDRNDPRWAEIAAGEAMFVIRHDEARPFVVTADKHRVVDAGTTFNLVRDNGRFTVEVIEGAVSYERGNSAVALAAGQTLETGDGPEAGVRTGRRPADDIAGWRRGRLSYSGAPLDRVARDLSRTLGTRVTVDPAISSLVFTGSLRVDRDAAESIATLAATLGLRARPANGAWRIEPGPVAPR